MVHYQWRCKSNPIAEARNNLGCAGPKGKLDEAIAHLQKALEIKPDYAEAHNNLGSLLPKRDRVDGAIAHYQKALEIKPDYAEAHNNLATPLRQKGRWTKRWPISKRRWKSSPTTRKPTQPWQRSLPRGRVDEAIAHFQKALEIKPEYAEAHYNLGIALAPKRKRG